MRQVTATEKYKAVNEGKMAKTEFVRQMRQSYPMYISQFNGFDDTVQILKNRGMLFETYSNPSKNLSDDSVRRGMDVEIAAMGHDPATCDDGEVQAKAKAKAIANIEKDPLHYYNLLAKESSKVDKNDKMKETKRGALEKDTFNDMKKATLKEAKLMTEGTRALVGYLSGDRLTTTYNHYDGYPENLGVGLETHYNDDEKAKEVAMKGYITYLNPETGEIEATHNDAPGKVILPDDPEQRAREIAEEIDKFGADFGYVWDDNSNQWITVKNTGIRSMIDQILNKLDMVNIHSGEKMKEANAIPTEPGIPGQRASNHDRKMAMRRIIDFLTITGHPETGLKVSNNDAIEFIKTHRDDIFDGTIDYNDINDVWANYDEYESVNTDYIDEKKGKDHDGDGDVDGDDYKAAKDKAIKKAMGKKSNVNEAVKNIITKILEEQTLNEAATNELARIADEYGSFEGLKPAVIALENIVTEIEAFYDKTRAKVQKIYDDLGEVRNDDGLKVGAFIAPSIENAFVKDLKHITKQQFHGGLDMPKVKRISQADIDRGYVQQEAPKDTVFRPVNEKK